MDESDKIISKLRELAFFLSVHDEPGWARGFERLANEVASDPDPNAAKAKVRRCYGGMGSFNDLVLHRDCIPLKSENNELDRMRRQLYELCESTPAGQDDSKSR